MSRILVQSQDNSKSLGVIELEHKRIHEGNGFNANKQLLDGETLETDDKLYICVSVGDFPIHLKTRRVQFDKSKVRVKIFEDADFDDENADEIPAYAMNRTNVKDAGMKLYNAELAPELEEATLIGENVLQGLEEGAGNRLVGSPAADDNTLEYIYKPNSKYVLELENIDDTTIEFMNVYWFWYVAGRS